MIGVSIVNTDLVTTQRRCGDFGAAAAVSRTRESSCGVQKGAPPIGQQIQNGGSNKVLYPSQCFLLGLELELIQTHMAQKPLLWVEVGAHVVRNRSKCGGVVWAGAGVAWHLGVYVVFEAFLAVWRRQLSLCGIPSQGVVCKTPTRYIFDIILYKQNINQVRCRSYSKCREATRYCEYTNRYVAKRRIVCLLAAEGQADHSW